METYTVKELFKSENITAREIVFLNKWLKKLMELNEEPMLPKITVANESWPSNQYPASTACHACALLVGLRSGKSPEEVGKSYVLYPYQKGWNVTCYDGEWEPLAEKLGLSVYSDQ